MKRKAAASAHKPNARHDAAAVVEECPYGDCGVVANESPVEHTLASACCCTTCKKSKRSQIHRVQQLRAADHIMAGRSLSSFVASHTAAGLSNSMHWQDLACTNHRVLFTITAPSAYRIQQHRPQCVLILLGNLHPWTELVLLAYVSS